MKKFIQMLASAAVITACATSGALLDKQSFRIIELNGTEYVSITDEPASISFDNGRCNAYVGGNRIMAGYKEGKGGKLTLSYGASTKMLVPDECREDEFLAAFNTIASYRIEGNTISFLNGEGDVLFKAEK